MAVFSRQLATTKRLIRRYGQRCIWRQPPIGRRDERDPSVLVYDEQPIETWVYVAFLPMERYGLVSQTYVEFSPLPSGVSRAYMADIGIKPTTKDVLIRTLDGNDIEYGIRRIDTLRVNEERPLLHTLEIEVPGGDDD